MRQGRLHAAHTLFQQALQSTTTLSDELLFTSSTIYIGLSMVQYEWNNMSLAAHYLEKSITLGKCIEDLRILPTTYILMANIKQVLGDEAGVDDALACCEQLLHKYHTLSSNTSIEIHKVKLFLRQGRHEDARVWAEKYAVSMAARHAYIYEAEHLMMIRFFIKDKQYTTALQRLQYYRERAEAGEATGSMIEILMLQALAYQAQGDHAQALQDLAHALSLAEPEGYMRLFVDEGEAMALLLIELQAAQEHNILPSAVAKDYLDRLLAALDRSASGAHTPELHNPQLPAPVLAKALSEREGEILRLIALGLSNQEIMHRLVIAKSTLKTHINHIYSKLAVHNRVQAIIQARELHLLDSTTVA
jgi:LuxR family maltose regulon positive regulatory protein